LVVTWLTPEAGRINTLLKGAFRPKSPFLGQVDLFSTCELLYYEGAPDGLLVTREVSPLNARTLLRKDWRACAVASYLCALISRATPPRATRNKIYEWLTSALDDVAANGGSVNMLCYQELRLLQLLGLAPRVDRCLLCSISLPESNEVTFSAREGGWWCDDCFSGARPANGVRVSAAAVRLIEVWQRASDPAVVRAHPASFLARDAAQRLLGLFTAYHLEMPASPRTAALDILSRQPAQPVDQAT
jgi:DNA repair protein RecO (recombination protein O)